MADKHPTAGELLDRARAMIPALRERSARTESLRRVAPETVNDFAAADFLRIAQPVRFGGLGHDVGLVAEIAMEIGRGCGASAWMAAQWPSHNFIVGYFPLQAQTDYWRDAADVFSSTASALARAAIEPTEGGMLVSGQWRFSSGVDEAAWILLATPNGLCLIPKSDFRIEDDWHVAGLAGSGSKSIVIDQAFVPDHRIVPAEAVADGRTHGAELYADPFYKAPYALWAPAMLASAVIGMAQGVVDAFDERVRIRKDGHTGSAATERPGVQLRFAEAAADVDAARLVLRNVLRVLAERGRGDARLSLPERACLRRDTAYAVKRCLGAANTLFESGDAGALYSSSRIQRMVRDLHAGALHISLTWDEPAIQYSRVIWDLPPQTRLI